MMVLTWNVTGWISKPYPVLWYFDPEHKGGASPEVLSLIRQRHYLTEAEQEEVAAIEPEKRLNYLAEKFPYKHKDAVDTAQMSFSLMDAIETVLDRKHAAYEATDGQRKFIKATSQ